jgi:hypothetical protein
MVSTYWSAAGVSKSEEGAALAPAVNIEAAIIPATSAASVMRMCRPARRERG